MDSDDYFDDDVDASFLRAVDAIEAAHTTTAVAASRPPEPNAPFGGPINPVEVQKPKTLQGNNSLARAPRLSSKISSDIIELDGSSSDYGFDDMPMDEAALASIDRATEIGYARYGSPNQNNYVASPSRASTLTRVLSKTTQMNLFGEVAREGVPLKAAAPNLRPLERTRSRLRQMPLAGQAKKIKQWDRTAYAKSGWRKPKPNPENENHEDDEEPVEFEQFPSPETPVGPVPSMKLVPDRLASKTWIYPLNKPKRDYQYNIVKNCLLENTLVALPTGLGKTFIAGVVMLNFYNWFPQGKVVFVAPTKPLVAQQIDACHQSCGIPGSAAVEITGSVPMAKRVNAWKTQRVFYATPQTFLNDLIRGIVDPLDIVLIVVDEAHRGTGDYAYAQVVRYMMQHNPHHRILALTATPGGKPEVVQAIVDALHISHIEIRSESDADLKKYLHTKHEQEHFVQMTEDICVLRDALAAIMVPLIKRVQSAGFLKNGNVQATALHPFRCQAAIGEMSKARAPQYAIGAVAQLGALARAMGYLMEMSITMCYGYLQDIAKGGANDSAGKKAIRKLDEFKMLMAKFEKQAARGLTMHPKMDVLRTLLIDHFAQRLPNEDEGATQADESRAMVFVSFRECVDEIVELLNKESPIIRAKPFIGQGIDKHGKKGYAQKEQLKVIEQFKAGKYNVLVSTSIGEEGLDIGEVDLIVCYDAQKTPIRMLQRIGRTGRKASGTVHILLAQGREEHNWQNAQSKYADVQHFIVRASELEVYGDVDRLIPPDIEPECREMEMEIEPYVRQERPSRKGSKATGSPKGPKRKRNDDPMRNVPTAAAKGFVSVADLLIKGKSKDSSKKATQKLEHIDWEHADEDDSEDEDIEAGLFAPPRRVKSTPASVNSSKGQGKKTALARRSTVAGPSKKTVWPKDGKQQSQLTLTSSDDTDDEAIERGLLASPVLKPKMTDLSKYPAFRSARPALQRSSSPGTPLKNGVKPDPEQSRSTATRVNLSLTARLRKIHKRISDSSPNTPLKSLRQSRSPSNQSQQSLNRGSSNTPERSTSPTSRSVSAENEKSAPGDDSMAWLVEDDEEPDIPEIAAAGPSRLIAPVDKFVPIAEPLFISSTSRESSPIRIPSDDEVEFVDEPRPKASPKRISKFRKSNMGPPALPSLIPASPSLSDDMPPESSFSVVPRWKRTRKRTANDVINVESSPLAPLPASQRRLKHERPKSPPPLPTGRPKRKKRKFEDTADAQRHNPWIDVEAVHSGDELSVGSSQPDLDYIVPDSDDGAFLQESATQASPSYDQSAIYRQSLMTQAPGGPIFANKPVRPGQTAVRLEGWGTERYRRAVTPPDEDDDYEEDSFVVDDDAEIAYSQDAPSSDL